MTSTPMNSSDLQRFIDTNGVKATILTMAGHTPTVNDAARELNVAAEQVIKSLIFTIKDRPLLVINNGNSRVDRKKIAARMGVGRNRVKFADPAKALTISGYVVGSMPPFGHRLKIQTLIDPAVTELERIFGGGGDIDTMLELTPTELLRVSEGELVAVSE